MLTRVSRNTGRRTPRPWTIAAVIPFAAAASLAAISHAPPAAQPPQAARTIWDGVYSNEQAKRGEEAYKLSCGYCHKDDLTGGFMDDGVGRAVALAGPRAFGSSFAERWDGQTLGDMVYAIASTMPKDAPTSLPLPAYVDIAAFLLEKNGAPAGKSELTADVSALRSVAMSRPR